MRFCLLKEMRVRIMAKVSVIVPVYNVQDYVEECIKSILNQTLADFEVICIDDGSKDNSGKILDRLAQMDRRNYFFAPWGL